MVLDDTLVVTAEPSTPVIMNVIMKPNWSYTQGLPS
ncbi:hypothetical protein JOD67_007563 [Tenggerimyces flavus]|nr:hypothetical protein [Tenggerimyces flavus]